MDNYARYIELVKLREDSRKLKMSAISDHRYEDAMRHREAEVGLISEIATVRMNIVESLLDMSDKDVLAEYMSLDKGSENVGIARILLMQTIKEEIRSSGEHYDGRYDKLMDALKK
jgi:hypothetical protein